MKICLALLTIWLAHVVGAEEATRAHGHVGLRLLPHDAVQSKEPWLEGIGNYADLQGQYPVVAEKVDLVWGPRGCFKTDKSFFEWYIEDDGGDVVNPDPKTSKLIEYIRRAEQLGMNHALQFATPPNQVVTSSQAVSYILICRETGLTQRGKPGPFPQDYRILHQSDVVALRKLFRDAHAVGLVKHDNYKLIQMVEHPHFFADHPEAQTIIMLMDGVVYEAHQFNRHWPLETGWSSPQLVVKGAKWMLAQGKEYIFYFGPFLYKESEHYREFIEREWLHAFWKAGLPKRHPQMHYFINAFPHAGCKRPVGPESDPHSNLGLTKWLMEELEASAD